jgi:hypothetical protein
MAIGGAPNQYENLDLTNPEVLADINYAELTDLQWMQLVNRVAINWAAALPGDEWMLARQHNHAVVHAWRLHHGAAPVAPAAPAPVANNNEPEDEPEDEPENEPENGRQYRHQ